MTPTYLIGKHLSGDLPELAEFAGPCALCSGSGVPGLPLADVLTDTFADIDWLQGGDYFCRWCLLCLGQGQPRDSWIKNVSCIATERELRRLTREQLWSVLLAPPAEPFVLNVSFDHKKHMSFKSRVNLGGSPYWVRSDRDLCRIDLATMADAVAVMQAWYTVCKAISTEPTWFCKDEILRGSQNLTKIAAYGTAKYRLENAVLEPLRGTHALEVLVYALNKKEMAS